MWNLHIFNIWLFIINLDSRKFQENKNHNSNIFAKAVLSYINLKHTVSRIIHTIYSLLMLWYILTCISCYLRLICTARHHRTWLSLTLTIMWGGYPVGPGPIDVKVEWCIVRCHFWLDSPWCNLLYYKAYCSYLTIGKLTFYQD